MINQMNTNDHTENQFFHALKELQIAKLLRRANITKTCGVSAGISGQKPVPVSEFQTQRTSSFKKHILPVPE